MLSQKSRVTDVRDLEVPFDTTFTSSVHCREVANTAIRVLFMVRRSFTELFSSVFFPLDCDIEWPHVEYAMKANAPTLRADFKQPERGHCPCNKASGRHSSRAICGKASPAQTLLADLNMAKIFKSEVDLSPSDFFLCKFRHAQRGHTYRLLQEPSRLRRRNGALPVRVVTVWTVCLRLNRNLSCRICVIPVPHHRHPDLYCSPRRFMFPLPPNSDLFMWSLLVLVANPTNNK